MNEGVQHTTSFLPSDVDVSVLTLEALLDETRGDPLASCSISFGLQARSSWLALGDGTRVADWLFSLDPQVMLRKSGRATKLTDCVRGTWDTYNLR